MNHDEFEFFGPAVYAAHDERCLDCRTQLSIEGIARKDDLCGPCADDEFGDWTEEDERAAQGHPDTRGM